MQNYTNEKVEPYKPIDLIESITIKIHGVPVKKINQLTLRFNLEAENV